MKTVSTPEKMSVICAGLKSKQYTIGFVPTMGALHEGHLTLVRTAKKHCDKVAVSIYINPTQFGPKEDLTKYPRNIKKDRALLKKEGVDLIFLPSNKSMYPQGYKIFVEVADLGKIMCGNSRPDHFRGVATIVLKLFNIVKPDMAFFGAKDFQQQAIIRKMVRDLNMEIKIITVPTVREKDGLAMSSRNAYLSIKERKIAPVLYRSLKMAKGLVKNGERDAQRIIAKIRATIMKEKMFNIDYIDIRNPGTLDKIKKIKGKTLIVLAAYLGRTRLIDNITA
ncbi:MAG: pantoate--beta-alanine ligase [Candidatus Margulisiibacteriota bacterium]